MEVYLQRKLRERGVVDESEPIDIRAVVERLIELGYVDDEVYAEAKAKGLMRRGYGARRVEQALRGAGIEAELREHAAPSEVESRKAALALARKRGFGPFSVESPDRAMREKQLAAIVRAGHSFEIARLLVEALDEASVEEWAHELDDEDD